MKKIPLIKPYISFEDVKTDFEAIFDSGWFTKGHYIADFKKEMTEYTSAKYSFPTTSATTALYACLKLMGITAGDEVIVSDFSFPATVNVVEEIGAKPIFADVSLDTYNMLPAELENKISSKTKAVIFVDAFGNLSGLDKIKKICEKNSLPLIEDAACAIGSSLNGIKSGNISDLTCFSFHPRKLLTCGEGGAIITNNPNYAEKLEILLNHGASVQDGKFDFVEAGYNFRMTELQAAMGISQLKKLDSIVESRNAIKESYNSELIQLGFIPQLAEEGITHNIQSLVYRVPEGCHRDNLIKYLAADKIETTIGTYCLSGLTYYSKKYDSICPNSKYLQDNCLTVPCYEKVDVQTVCNKIKLFLGRDSK
ncbi:dTDP-4-amino-4,6-dideoxygalactose transaminase [Maridesulfovibrio ferrireducens]|uniref:dTDP-4-amino-4,6-dideoxygalactose transaminase n=1 Tax=Maridesulfovibrio ferrireducens TaxID=246191 RepID=A0A1G9CLU4_9BACT|nr:DegT/DnrJ/EryC1/StrS family aminotransferase [Maridesulfovibrio ferrireducens]SDK52627.1 dTDP-4-amino-4,6-dideoxygalactose transaminase [Maridesulfovibrio ferrireducens]